MEPKAAAKADASIAEAAAKVDASLAEVAAKADASIARDGGFLYGEAHASEGRYFFEREKLSFGRQILPAEE